MLGGWFQLKSMPWWAGFGPLVAGILQLMNHFSMNSDPTTNLGLVGDALDAGLSGTPPFALVYLGVLLIWANRKYLPKL